MMHFADSPKVSFVLEFALCKQLEQLNALATGRCRLLFSSECKELAMHHFFGTPCMHKKLVINSSDLFVYGLKSCSSFNHSGQLGGLGPIKCFGAPKF